MNATLWIKNGDLNIIIVDTQSSTMATVFLDEERIVKYSVLCIIA